MRRIFGVATAVATVAAVLALSAPSGAAVPALSLSASSVGRGATITVRAPGCKNAVAEGPGIGYRAAEVVLITGTGAGERMAAHGTQGGPGDRYTLTVPGWVDPSQPAVVAGWCSEQSFDDAATQTQRIFTYPDVAVDVTAGSTSAPSPAFTLDRTTAAAGQVLRVTATGCGTSDFLQAVVYAGGDPSGRTLEGFVTGGSVIAGRDDGRPLELALSTGGGYVGETGDRIGGPLPEGDYTVLVVCGRERPDGLDYILAEPAVITVAGTNPSGDIEVSQRGDQVVAVSGGGCGGGRPVSVTFSGYAESDFGNDGFVDAVERGRPIETVPSVARIAPDTRGQFTETLAATVETDGTWSLDWPAPDAFTYFVEISADCGDPFVDGFRYVEAGFYADSFSDLWTSRVNPTSSPTGGPVEAHLEGACEGRVRVSLLDATGAVRAESTDVTLDGEYGQAVARLNAPATAGTYRLSADCDGAPSYPERYEVFAPTTLADPAPLPAEPTTGWPSVGERETYHGRIGPIVLRPGMDMGDMDMGQMGLDDLAGSQSAGRFAPEGSMATLAPPMGPGGGGGLPSSGIGVEVPRPEGDFAITGATFDLVDESGTAVPQSAAHLHHFVVSNVNSQNPACPGSTFGLPGEIVAASGAERTALSVGDPYGIVVEDDDAWFGVYDLMSRSDETQTVYLSYDLTIRRDVENVRPVHTYFGSATGCGSFTWDIDGSGTPDTQSAYVPIARDGVMVGAGAHIHNGGSHADLTDDRGRRLCRSELRLGDAHGGHGGHRDHGGMAMDVMDGVGDDGPGYAPEFYPDDPEILGITNCQVREQVRAGERLRFDAVYTNERPRSAVMGIYTFYIWEGGGPANPRGPGDPGGPGGLGGPNGPNGPNGPGGPGGPDRPGDPGGPSGPGGSDRPDAGNRPDRTPTPTPRAPGARPVTGRPDYAG